MAKNYYGFIPKKYQQPSRYKELFGHFNAVYHSMSGREFHIEARPFYLVSNPIGAKIDTYLVLEQKPGGRKSLGEFKTMKAAMELLSRFLNK